MGGPHELTRLLLIGRLTDTNRAALASVKDRLGCVVEVLTCT